VTGPHDPQFPIFIPTKGRANKSLTSRSLTALGVPHTLVVEEQERAEYEAVHGENPLVSFLTLDPDYQRAYDTCDRYGSTKSKGPGPARNFIWDQAIKLGFEWHWVMDDNIQGFWHYHENRLIRLGDGTGIRAMEDFTIRYDNVAMAGPNYYMFVTRKAKYPPFVINTRIYSCALIRNDVPFRWRARYNEDTDLSLRLLKAGWCTIQFNAFLQWKPKTQLTPGGNTSEFYEKEGTLAKSLMLARLHPDVARVTRKFGRVHHAVDYRPFKAMPLHRREDAEVPDGDPYRLRLVEIETTGPTAQVRLGAQKSKGA
jgi:hypothetical protein